MSETPKSITEDELAEALAELGIRINGNAYFPELARNIFGYIERRREDGVVKISGEDPRREYEDALAARSQALAETERTERLVDRARSAYERHLRRGLDMDGTEIRNGSHE
jgi:hypothetical protein